MLCLPNEQPITYGTQKKAGLLCRSTQLGDSPAQPPARYRPHRTKRGGGLLGVPPRPVTPASSAVPPHPPVEQQGTLSPCRWQAVCSCPGAEAMHSARLAPHPSLE